MLVKRRIPFTQFLIVALATIVSFSTLASYKVVDSEGTKTLSKIPKRVAVLNWGVAEQVIELGTIPVAMSDIKGYQQWVVKPAVPKGVVDIGTRAEPNFELLAELKPDVILIASPQKDLEKRLERIAPVLYYQTFSESHNNAQAAITNFLRIGHVLGKEKLAKKKLAQMKHKIQLLKEKLNVAYPNGKPKVTAFRFASTTSVYLYGNNSIPQYALKELGFQNAMPQPSTQWGVTQKRLTDLKNIGNGIALYFLPFSQQAQLNRSVIWNAMPFVRDKKVASVPSTWSYGGALSIQYNAEALAESLLKLAGS
ncbi:iron-siderophore ABC transporter substrate-binding protein [Vibrio marisflavi]|uniref:Petrobactin-binding protein FpuA n=1 Tax=Vibrio marisflavi CECT 7928 TaxID=634439 RepID=A0ABN8E9Q2_9VIBR|nr:iron-siderophore ABC transporter substrate-binding protein [Vibrio marisflavi]CAH0541726.1 Petrobactin-binding protein FpuA [Vibrio marisflavi CECT 7928]